MKKLFSTAAVAAILATSPAFAWHPIVIYNHTDPDLVHGVQFDGGGVPSVGYIVDVPQGSFRVFGPLPEGGGCLRTLTVQVTNPRYNPPTINVVAPTQMNVCTEGYIVVSGYWNPPPFSGSPIVITHGVGSGPAGSPGK